MQITYVYDQVKEQATRKGICPVCGKRGQRQTTISQTVNPFNKNEDGSIKTYREVAQAVHEEAKEWAQGAFIHERCES